jgi:hypothetical protein
MGGEVPQAQGLPGASGAHLPGAGEALQTAGALQIAMAQVAVLCTPAVVDLLHVVAGHQEGSQGCIEGTRVALSRVELHPPCIIGLPLASAVAGEEQGKMR